MAAIDLDLGGSERRFSFRKLIMAGYTGRDQGEVRAHIEELLAHGIPAPSRTPTLFACTPALLTTAEGISVLGDATSGEGEAVLFADGDELLVGVGSDHTDRDLEATDIPRAKQVCAKVVSRAAWRFAEVADHWDELILRSWVGEGGGAQLYQEGALARLLRPEAVLDYVRRNTVPPLEPAVIFAGTLPLLTDGFRPSAVFTAELEDPRRQRTLRCRYRIATLDYLR
jgi:hypothetical protein